MRSRTLVLLFFTLFFSGCEEEIYENSFAPIPKNAVFHISSNFHIEKKLPNFKDSTYSLSLYDSDLKSCSYEKSLNKFVKSGYFQLEIKKEKTVLYNWQCHYKEDTSACKKELFKKLKEYVNFK